MSDVKQPIPIGGRPSPNLLLAASLTRAKAISRQGILRTADLSRTDRERLQAADWLCEIIKGWYVLTTPEGDMGNSTAWFIKFWPFLSFYLGDKFGNDYCLSAECSLDLHVGESVVPPQVVVITSKAINQTLKLPHTTSLLIYSEKKGLPKEIVKVNDVNAMSLPLALCKLASNYFQEKHLNVEIALKLIQDTSNVSRTLIENQWVAAAGRISGAFRFLGDSLKADKIVQDMQSAGFKVQEGNPFSQQRPWLPTRQKLTSPYSGRIEAMWMRMRPFVIENFPKLVPNESEKPTIRIIKELYQQDAYHSLSIEGYQVTEEMIQKIASGQWDPANIETDREQRDALAAKGYHQAFGSVLASVSRVLKKERAGEILEQDMQEWYRQLFLPLTQANLLSPSQLAGYRNSPVYIKKSLHVPPNKDALPDLMETFFKLVKEEDDARVRATLGHFVFVFIHPYPDGNGRIGRFLMNLMLVSGGYNWTVIRNENRNQYMASLEEASVRQDIVPFTKFLSSEFKHWNKWATQMHNRKGTS